MEYRKPPYNTEDQFSFFGLGFILFGFFAYLLVLADFFSRPLLSLFGAFTLLGIGLSLSRLLRNESWPVKTLFIASFSIAAWVMSFAEPTVFSGRDQGSISEAAFELAAHEKLSFAHPSSELMAPLYGTGRALNFPGFFYTDTKGALLTQFPLGYTAWVASFISLFGISGIFIANGLLLALSLLSIFFLVRIFAGAFYGSLAFVIASASFLPLWFAKFTLTENLALFLFLFTSFNIILFLQKGKAVFFLTSYLGALYFAVTRIEGLWVFCIALLLLLFSPSGKKLALDRPWIFRYAPAWLGVGILTVNASANLPFYTMMGKALLKNFNSLSGGAADASAETVTTFFSLFALFLPYGLFFIMLAGFMGILWLLKNKCFHALVPTLLSLPFFLYFLDPNITQDHPWMLRRFLSLLWPTLLFSAVTAFALFFSQKFPEKPEKTGRLHMPFHRKVAIATTLFFVALQLPSTTRTVFSRENPEMLAQTESLARAVGDRDLLLIDRLSTGDGYAIPAGPLRFLFKRNALYFFNPEDYAKINKEAFEHVYILMPAEHFEFWKAMPVRFEFVSAVSFSTSGLESLPLTTRTLPQLKNSEQSALLFELKPSL